MSAGLLLHAPLRDEERRAASAEDWIAIATAAAEAGCAALLLSAGPIPGSRRRCSATRCRSWR